MGNADKLPVVSACVVEKIVSWSPSVVTLSVYPIRKTVTWGPTTIWVYIVPIHCCLNTKPPNDGGIANILCKKYRYFIRYMSRYMDSKLLHICLSRRYKYVV